MVWESHHGPSFDTSESAARRNWKVGGLVLCSFVLLLQPLLGQGGQPLKPLTPPQDHCQSSLGHQTKQLSELLARRLKRGFLLTEQLDEGNGRLSSWSVPVVDCEQQHVVASANYEFRGNLGVMDITRRGTAVLRFQLSFQPQLRQIKLENPEILDVTFDNPAPWFDGKAISNWVLSMFGQPVCVNLHNGQSC